ncbi:MAG TPA: aldo/keto reductase, partial [Asanoa sp.]|nr:aldo/keto reductase [Asanoa sp.]
EDAEVLAYALRQPWIDVVLSGAATTDQLASNLRALEITDPGRLPAPESPDEYWRHRSALPWS